MKLFRLRFVLLGLLLCVCHVWSLSCRTEFDDPESYAYQSEVVFMGKVEQILPPKNNNLYNVTVKIKNRDIFKGLEKGPKVRRIRVGQFGPENIDNCIARVERDKDYFFFLNSTSDSEFLTTSRMPLISESSKHKKVTKGRIKKILSCKSGNCVKVPVARSSGALKDRRVGFGKAIKLRCRIRRTTLPQAIFLWYKDDVELQHNGIKGLSIKTGKKGSRLTKQNADPKDDGIYVCVVKNVGGEIRQQARITVTGVKPPKPSDEMKDKKQKFGGTLKLTCSVKSDTVPKPTFSWFKDGKEIKSGSKPFLTIKSRGYQSRLVKQRAGLSDGGLYKCVTENTKGKNTQTSNVTITDAPQKIRPCDEEDKYYCLNNGTCNVMVELDQKFCTCQPGYKGDRCLELDLRFNKAREQKLAQDRTIVVVGIISGILLFIGICVASYFLAQRRRKQFRRRRNQNASHIEDIPQVYRPLKACDDVDGPGKHKTSGVIIHKETQTIETCFLAGAQEDPKLNLYINPLEGYIPPNREDRNSRSRLTAVSLEGNQRSNPPNSLERSSSPSYGKRTNDIFPNRSNSKRVPSERENSKPNGARDRVVSPNVGSMNPPAFNLDTDSEDEILNEETPLTPLHISEDDDTLRRRRERQSNDNNISKFSYPRDSSNDSNYSKPPSYTTALESDKTEKLDRVNSEDRIYASTSPSSSESSSTTEGCDSPNSRYLNELSLSDTDMNIPPYWNERGSPEPRRESPLPYKPVPKYDYPPPYANSDKRASTKTDHIGNFNRGEIGV